MNKQIEEMAHDMCEYYYEGTCYQDKKPCDCKCDIFTDAEYLYAKGYRKASTVAREISQDIIEPLWNAYKNSTCQETVLLVALIRTRYLCLR